MSNELFMLQLDCKHLVYFKNPTPVIGTILWCQKCRKDSRVESAPEEWKIRCVNCIYSRSFGVSKLDAELSVGRHRNRYPDHKVKLFNGSRLVRTIGIVQPSLF